jgi:aspartyl-tRNA(Asn)/glutamyl-tRNA(Gln) amidotransferase subunit A
MRERFPKTLDRKITFGVPKEYNLPTLHPATKHAWAVGIQRLQSAGHIIQTISLPRTKDALSAYYVLATAEAASNLARFDGVRYGYHYDNKNYKESVFQSRAQGFGEEVRRRILLGNYTLSAKYLPCGVLTRGGLKVISCRRNESAD